METEPNSILIVILLAVLLCFSAFFSSSETAFSSLNKIKLKNLAEKSKKRESARARLALKLFEIYDSLLTSVLIGNNIVNIAASALATSLFIGLFGSAGVTIATILMTILILIFSDITPKTLAKETPEATALRLAPLVRFFIFIFKPFCYLAAQWKKLIMKIFAVKVDRSTTEDEFLTFVEEVRQEGGITPREENMIRHAIDFDDLKVSEIFTPRLDVVAVSGTSTIEEIDRKFMESGFSRLPVYRDTIDNITGILIFKDFYHKVIKGQKTIAEILKPAVFVTKTIKIAKLLQTMQEKQTHMVVVVDEHGGILGIATIEDIVEELVGEIWDEHDKVIEPVKKTADGGFKVQGNVSFSDMLEFVTEKPVPNDDDIPDTTVANWIMENAGRLPRVGEKFNWQYLTISVLRVLRQRVMEVRVTVSAVKMRADTKNKTLKGDET